jgi:hypothetical protein
VSLTGFEVLPKLAANHQHTTLCCFTFPCAGGAIVLPVSLAGSPPFTGLLDLSAATSILNWEAAALLGMTCTEQQQEERQWQQQQQQHKDGSSSGGGSKPADSGSSTSSSSGSAANMYGYFGNIEVLPDAELLLQRPKLPGGSSSSSSSGLLADEHHAQQQQQPGHVAGHDSSSGNSPGSGVQSQQQHLPKIPLLGTPGANISSSSSSSSSSGGVWLNGNVQPFNIAQGAKGSNISRSSSSSRRSSNSSSVGGVTPLRVQQHKAAASSVALVLGHARLAAAASNIGSSSSSSGSLLLSPPSRFGVAGLRGLAQLGLSGQPAMVVGADVWGRQRAVLCLKSGWLYLSDRSAQVHQ